MEIFHLQGGHIGPLFKVEFSTISGYSVYTTRYDTHQDIPWTRIQHYRHWTCDIFCDERNAKLAISRSNVNPVECGNGPVNILCYPVQSHAVHFVHTAINDLARQSRFIYCIVVVVVVVVAVAAAAAAGSSSSNVGEIMRVFNSSA